MSKKVRGSFDFMAWWEKNQKPVLSAVTVVLIVILGWIGYQKFISEPRNERANTALATVQMAFQQAAMTPQTDTAAYKFVLDGQGAMKGALSIIKSYGSTDAGNLARFYAGESYLHLGDFNNAVKYLSTFSTDQKQIQMMAYGSLGDAYSELKQNAKAIESYKKAASTFEDDDVNSSEFLFRAAMLSELGGNTKDAVTLYKQLKDKFPNTQEGMQADKYINRLEVQPLDN